MARTMYCSFCSRSHHDVDKLVAGPGVFICDACIKLSVRAIKGQTLPSFPTWEQMDDDELLERLGPAQASTKAMEDNLRRMVRILRKRRMTWERIGNALAVTRQAACARFGT